MRGGAGRGRGREAQAGLSGPDTPGNRQDKTARAMREARVGAGWWRATPPPPPHTGEGGGGAGELTHKQ